MCAGAPAQFGNEVHRYVDPERASRGRDRVRARAGHGPAAPPRVGSQVDRVGGLRPVVAWQAKSLETTAKRQAAPALASQTEILSTLLGAIEDEQAARAGEPRPLGVDEPVSI
jgi:hypothetical protein